MKEPWWDGVKRRWREWRIKALWWVVRKAVRRIDVLQWGVFMAYSWGYDEVTDYNVLAERHLENCHVYGTKVTFYDENKEE